MHLLDEVLAAYGGQDRWNQVDSIKIHQLIGGSLWQLKGVNGILDDSTVEIQPRNQRAWHRPLPEPGLRSSYSPQLVAIETDEETPTTIETLSSPRESFAGHMPVTRIVYVRDHAGHPLPDMVTVTIDIDDVTVR